MRGVFSDMLVAFCVLQIRFLGEREGGWPESYVLLFSQGDIKDQEIKSHGSK